jgi:molybdate transport system regulatory protein
MKASSGSNRSSEPRVRILSGSAVALGPGKADLLTAIDETGSISAAARQMRMSYRRAWLLVRTMNDCFRSPLVEAEKGGTAGGGARLTPTGREVLAHYQDMVRAAAEHFSGYLRPARPRARRTTKPTRRRPARV